MLCKFQHFAGYFYVKNVAEIILGRPQFVGIPQRRAHQPVFPSLKHDHALALCKHNTTERYHSLAAHRFPDHGESILPDFVIWANIVGALEIAFIYLFTGNDGDTWTSMVGRLAHYCAVRVQKAGRNEIHPGMRLSRRPGYGNDG